jgi:hypothetical protein
VILLTPRDLELVGALCHAVRLFAWEQVLTWWPTPAGRRLAYRRVATLVRLRLLRRFRVHARPVPWPDKPAAVWRPGTRAPDMAAVGRALAARWTRPPVTTTVYVATRRAANLLGGSARGRVGTPYQASHDLGVSAVYLHYLRHRPDDAACWVGEDNARAAGRGNKKPDAVVLDPGSGRRLAVEFGAGYPAARLRAFHRHCERHRLPYEVW